jgi:uncharacterized membrane protein YcaP (DUF421 family)
VTLVEAVHGWMDWWFGLSSRAEELSVGQMSARAFVMYVALLIIVRTGKKRFLGRATAFDIILVITLGSIAARAITGGAGFFAAMLALVTLVVTHWVFSWLARDSGFFSHLIKGRSTVLVKDGQVNRAAMRAEHISDDDLAEDLRDKGFGAHRDIAEARLERSGKVSVVGRK